MPDSVYLTSQAITSQASPADRALNKRLGRGKNKNISTNIWEMTTIVGISIRDVRATWAPSVQVIKAVATRVVVGMPARMPPTLWLTLSEIATMDTKYPPAT